MTEVAVNPDRRMNPGPAHEASTARLCRPPRELREHPNWINWKYYARDGDPAGEKAPVDARSGRKINALEPANWLSYEEACSTGENVGFVLDGSGLVGIDLDDCFLGDSTTPLKPWAREVVETLDSYTEVSPSGRGLKIFIRAELPADWRKSLAGRDGSKIEIYGRGRFFAVTGQVYERRGELCSRQHELDEAYTMAVGATRASAPGRDAGERQSKEVRTTPKPELSLAFAELKELPRGWRKLLRPGDWVYVRVNQQEKHHDGGAYDRSAYEQGVFTLFLVSHYSVDQVATIARELALPRFMADLASEGGRRRIEASLAEALWYVREREAKSGERTVGEERVNDWRRRRKAAEIYASELGRHSSESFWKRTIASLTQELQIKERQAGNYYAALKNATAGASDEIARAAIERVLSRSARSLFFHWRSIANEVETLLSAAELGVQLSNRNAL